MTVNMGNVGDLCRLCARTSENIIHVFSEEGLAKGLPDKIHTHLPIMVTADDCLPTVVCSNCSKALDVCHNLLQLCLDADVQLRKILQIPEDPDHTAAMMFLRESLGTKCDFVSSFQNKSFTGNESYSSHESESTTHKVKSGMPVGELVKSLSPSLLPEEDKIKNGASRNYHQIENARVESVSFHLSHIEDDSKTFIKCSEELMSSSPASCSLADWGPGSPPIKQKTYTEIEEQVVDSAKPITCSKCGGCFKNKHSLQLHLKKHIKGQFSKTSGALEKGKRLAECRVCGKHFESFWYMARHRTNSHSKDEIVAALQLQGLERENFECGICGKLLSCQNTLKNHMQRHSGERNFHCGECGCGFAYKAQLKSHLFSHTGGSYSCTECPKQFRNAFALRVHLRTHTGERPFACEHCPKAFHSRANYEQHLQVHSTVRRFKCTFCPYRARRPEALKTHIRVHTNERPYECKLCGRAFKQKNDCKKHENLHEKKPGITIKARGVKTQLCQVAQTGAPRAPQTLLVAQNEENQITDCEILRNSSDTVETTVATNVISSISADSTGKVFDYQDSDAHKIVISEISFEENAQQQPSFWSSALNDH